MISPNISIEHLLNRKGEDSGEPPRLLFQPFTYVEPQLGFPKVMLHWFVPFRQHPAAPYAELIRDYETLDLRARPQAESRVNELLTQRERDIVRQCVAGALGA